MTHHTFYIITDNNGNSASALYWATSHQQMRVKGLELEIFEPTTAE